MMSANPIMKTGLRTLCTGRKNRWLILCVFALGFAIQIFGKCLPTLVVCYKANEKPKIEFWQDGCDCRRECADHVPAGCREGCANLRSACLDVPLLAYPGCGPLPRSASSFDNQGSRANKLPAAPPAPVLFSARLDGGAAPPQGPGIDNASHPFPKKDRDRSFFCLFRC